MRSVGSGHTYLSWPKQAAVYLEVALNVSYIELILPGSRFTLHLGGDVLHFAERIVRREHLHNIRHPHQSATPVNCA